jgi:hypothetical protein
MEALMQNLRDNSAHVESKLVSIVAIGDLLMQCRCQAYLPELMVCFERASILSLDTSVNEDDQKLRVKFSESLIDSYNSLLHGLPTPTSQSDLHEFATQIYYYVSSLVNQCTMNFS